MLEAELGRILKPESVEAIATLSLAAQRVAHRWILGWPGEAKVLEDSGTLIDELKRQARREESALADARRGGDNSFLADHEILELHDISPQPPG